jgi:hypothetical protein
MQTIAPFGIITACHAGDYFLAKATCASIRHYMPEIPVCVIADGDFSISELKKCHGVMELRVSDFSDSRLPPICKGTSRTKFAAIWESPFDRFLCIDADVIVLGDWSSILCSGRWDFLGLANEHSVRPSESVIEHFFFNSAKLAEYDQEFDLNNRLYFCAGAYAAAKNCLSVDEFLSAAAFEECNPGTFKFSDQGIFNYLVMKGACTGALKVKMEDRQYILPDHPRDQTIRLFGSSRIKVPGPFCEPQVLHFCGTKPLLQYHNSCDYVFTAFRLLHLVKKYKNFTCPRALAWLKILCEELSFLIFRLRRTTQGFLPYESLLSSGMFGGRAGDNQVEVVNKLGKLPGLLNSKKNQSNTEIIAEFGIVTACHQGDYFMAKATCASIRYFMPDVPICVIVDGDFDITELQKKYDVIVMRTAEIRDARLREMCCRSTRSKLAAQWEGPFERYLWVDCDTVVLGDIVHAEPWGEADFWPMTSIEPGTVPDRNLRHYFLDPDEMKRIDAAFDANKHALFCDGAYVTRRGCLDLDRTYYMWKKTQFLPHLFSWTKCQGLTNYIVFSSESCGELSVRACDRQYIVPDHARLEFEQKFGVAAKLPPREFANPSVVHFCGVKPLIQNWYAPSSLFTAFRILHYSNVYGGRPLATFRSWAKILREEFQMLKPRLFRKLFIK